MENSNLKKNIYIFIWAVILIIFQTSICEYWSIKGIHPNVLFTFVICLAVLEKNFTYCAAVPVILGIVIDTLCGNTIFYSMISFSISALICYEIGEHFFKEKFVFALPLVFIFTFITEFLFMILSVGITDYEYIISGIVNVIIPVSVYNTVMALIIYPLCKFTLYKKARRELVKKVKKY